MIPSTSKRPRVYRALAQIDEWMERGEEIPSPRQSRGMHADVAGCRFPPKYVISLAGSYADGQPVPATVFTTTDAVRRLERPGLSVVGEDRIAC